MFVLERPSKNVLFKLFGVSVLQGPCTTNNYFFIFNIFLFLKQDCIRFFLLSCEVGMVKDIISILQIKNLRDRDEQRFI